MKKVTIMMSMLLALGSFCACSSDDEMDGIGSGGSELIPPRDSLAEERLKSVPEYDYTGRLRYEECFKTWVISYYHPGSIDGVDIYYPLNLPNELCINKEEGVDVSFSGKVIEMTDEDIKTQQIVLLGGYHYYYVYLTKIKKAE
jgi:hypothetical protein